jgi:predicted nucleotidyltransferase
MRETTKQVVTLDDLRVRRHEIVQLAEQHGAYDVRVFGSVARGEATPESDVDILVSFRDGASLYELSGLWQDLEELLGCQVDLATDDEHPRRARFLRRALKEAVPL